MTAALPCRLPGLGIALPQVHETNHDLAARLDTTDEWIRSRTGIEARHVAVDETTTDLAVAAGRSALADAGLDADRIDLVVVATSTPDTACPSTASRVAAELGSSAPSFDLNGACTGFVHAVAVASTLLRTTVHGRPGHALVIGADRYRSLTDPRDRTTNVLFGDGAGAVVVRIDPHRPAPPSPSGGIDGPITTDTGTGGIAGLDLRGDPGGLHALQIPLDESWLHMDGPEVFRRAVRGLVASTQRALDQAGLAPTEVDRFVPHQANVRIIDAAAQRLGIPADRIEIDLTQRANTSAASIPLALHTAVRADRIHHGDHVLLGAVGAGMGVGSIVLRWQR